MDLIAIASITAKEPLAQRVLKMHAESTVFAAALHQPLIHTLLDLLAPSVPRPAMLVPHVPMAIATILRQTAQPSLLVALSPHKLSQ